MMAWDSPARISSPAHRDTRPMRPGSGSLCCSRLPLAIVRKKSVDLAQHLGIFSIDNQQCRIIGADSQEMMPPPTSSPSMVGRSALYCFEEVDHGQAAAFGLGHGL